MILHGLQSKNNGTNGFVKKLRTARLCRAVLRKDLGNFTIRQNSFLFLLK